MKWTVLIIMGLISSMSWSIHAIEQVRTIPPQSEYDASHSYFIGLLEMSLEKTAEKYGTAEVAFTLQMEQGRAFFELEKGSMIDVYWAGTSIEREQKFIAIRIPLVKGILGFRMGIVHRDRERIFAKIQDLEDLKKFDACQGAHWPDSDILEAAGLKVVRNAAYESMFLQVSRKRCDYFPRGVHEGVVEMEARAEKYPNLTLSREVIIYYPFPMYFFVSASKIGLADRLTEGLKKAVADGSFEKHMRQHPTTAHLFPMENWINATTIVLENPELPKDTPVDDQRYWISPRLPEK